MRGIDVDATAKPIRAFVAVAIPEPIRRELSTIQATLREKLPGVAWTRPNSIHLTLQFLGNVSGERITELVAELNTVGQQHQPFDLGLGQLGSFGQRVLWVGLSQGVEPLGSLAKSVQAKAARFGEHRETREFNPHVTLGRIRLPTRGVATALRQVPLPDWPTRRVEHFELIQSELSSAGSRYTTLATIPLGVCTP
jgi:RNA 2',3'-cyclic 3'-phosphodiesterase